MTIIKFEPAVLKIESRFKGARFYLKMLEESLPRAKDRAARRLKEEAEARSWPAHEYSAEDDDLKHDFEQVIPCLASSAFIAYLHSVVEYGLSVVCDRLHDRNDLPLKASELSGSAIERSKNYLTKLAKIKVANHPSWSCMKNLAKLRNVMLHAGGELERSGKLKEDISLILEQYPNEISIQDLGWSGTTHEICLSLSLCGQLLNEVELFFGWLLKAAQLQGVTIDDEGT